MKNKTLLLSTLSIVILLIGCSKDSEDEFNNANGTTVEKLIKTIEIIDEDYPNESVTYTFNYGSDNKLSSYTGDGTNTFFNYDQDGNLNTITDPYETLNMSELYQAPYDVFETGDVLEYDNNGNPIKIEVWESGFGSDLLNGEILYDPNPNPYFYTLKAAGLIDAFDIIDFNFGYNVPEIVQARKILPLNNIRTMIFKNMSGVTVDEIQINYEYDSDGYPITADILEITLEETYNLKINYTYK